MPFVGAPFQTTVLTKEGFEIMTKNSPKPIQLSGGPEPGLPVDAIVLPYAGNPSDPNATNFPVSAPVPSAGPDLPAATGGGE
jgi:hypothetical protein